MPIHFSEATRAGIRFTERMTGYLSRNPTVRHSYRRAAARGARDGETLELTLTIDIPDLDQMLEDPAHPATLTGTAIAPGLSPHTLTVTEGLFSLFIEDQDRVETREMRYRGKMIAPDGIQYYFHGFKVIQNDPGLDLWADTTKLYVTIHQGGGSGAPVLARGIVRVSPADFLRQLLAFRPTNVHRVPERIDVVGRFLVFFANALRNTYGRVLARSCYFDPYAAPRPQRPIAPTTSVLYRFETGDNVRLQLTRYQGGVNGPVILASGFGVSGLSFSIDTVEENLVEFLARHGYDVWVLDYRASPVLAAHRTQFTIDDIAAHDWPTAINFVYERTGKRVQVVAHCVGSLSFLMAMLDGRLDAKVRFAVCSQLGVHPIGNLLNAAKAGFHLGTLLSLLGLKTLRVTTDVTADRKTRFVNQVLKLYPTKEPCNNPVCRRLWFILGESYRHAQLNQATHDAIHEMFDEANLLALRHLARMLRQGYVVDKDGNDRYMPNVRRLNIPITFLHGTKNRIFLPQGTEKTWNWLRAHNGGAGYERHKIRGYAHLDCFIGRNARRDVFPVLLQELDAHP